MTRNFTLPSGFTGAQLNLSSVDGDDIVSVALNGTVLGYFGLHGPGNGYFYPTASGPSIPVQAFASRSPLTASGPFVAGLNSLVFTVNNNGSGINSGNNGLTGGMSSLFVTGKISFNAVPEPGSWALLIAGFGLVGAAQRRRAVLARAKAA